MSIPYRDADEVEEWGAAGYLKIESSPGGPGYLGALFLINARGEPIEFSYNRIETPHTFLWRQADIHRHAERKLVVSLLSICPRTPRILVCLAEEVGSELFCQDIQLSIPICRIAPAIKATAYSAEETVQVAETSEPMHLFWFPSRPQDDSIELRLLHELTSRGLLLEPFERASVGLGEVYRTKDGAVK